MATILTPQFHEVSNCDRSLPRMFLGGSIEMGAASNWQNDVIASFYDSEIVLFNPRRNDWNPTWEQSRENIDFTRQVNWELDALADADAILMNLEPGTMSPISILEFGLYAGKNSIGGMNKMIVCCPQGFWRKGNIDIVAERYNIPVVDSLEEMILDGTTLMYRNHQRRIEFSRIE